jgi:hypothetical protein
MADVGRQASDFGILRHGILFFWLYLPLLTFIHLYWDGVGLPQEYAERSIVGVQRT